MQMSTFPKLQRLISSKPFVRFEFRANFWPLQGPQKSIIASKTVSSQAKFRQPYANEHFIKNHNQPQLYSTLPQVAAGRTGLLARLQHLVVKSTSLLNPWGLFTALRSLLLRSASVVGATGLRPRLSPGVQRAVVEVTRCRHQHLPSQVSRVPYDNLCCTS